MFVLFVVYELRCWSCKPRLYEGFYSRLNLCLSIEGCGFIYLVYFLVFIDRMGIKILCWVCVYMRVYFRMRVFACVCVCMYVRAFIHVCISGLCIYVPEGA